MLALDFTNSAAQNLDYEHFSDFLCGGCIATKKASETASPSNQSHTIARHSRHCHVRCLRRQQYRISNQMQTTNTTTSNRSTRKRGCQFKLDCSHRFFNLIIMIIIMIVLMAGRRKAVDAAPLGKSTSNRIAATATAATVIAKATVVKTVSSLAIASDGTSETKISPDSTPVSLADKTSHRIASGSNIGGSSNYQYYNHHNNNNATGNSSKLRQHKRHSKRHSNWYDYVDYNENSTILEWANPCGGYYDPTQMGGMENYGYMRRIRNKEIFNILKRSVGNEFKTLNGSQQDIDLSNIKLWSLYEYTYKFLPKLKMNSSIALRRWYRNTQTYVASFAYLRRIQLKWDHNKRQRESRIAIELKHLLLSSRSMLCELETAINSTQPQRRNPYQLNREQQQQQKPRLFIFSRQQMNKRLKLRTKRRNERSPDVLHEADSIDLQYVKLYYYEFLETMWKLLRKNMKRRGQIGLRGNRKEFNEVSKQFGSQAGIDKSHHRANAPRRIETFAAPRRENHQHRQQHQRQEQQLQQQKRRRRRRQRQRQRRNKGLSKPYIERTANTGTSDLA